MAESPALSMTVLYNQISFERRIAFDFIKAKKCSAIKLLYIYKILEAKRPTT